jgi:glycosyltransferase involved in cell wall biosynthesis
MRRANSRLRCQSNPAAIRQGLEMSEDRSAGRARAEMEQTEGVEPRFSVCIPVYNDGDWLPSAIESVLGQTYPAFELVIGDNVSTQPIDEIVARYHDPRLRYHRWREHLPTYENFNRTIFLGRSEWVLPLGADDRIARRCLEVLADRIRAARVRRQPLVMVVTASRRVDPQGQRADRAYYGSQGIKEVPEGIHQAAGWLGIGAAPGLAPWNVGSIAFDRQALERAGGFRPEIGLSADLELILRLAAYGDVSYVAEPLLDYTVRGDSDGNLRFLEDRVQRRAATPIGAALLAALDAHAKVRSVDSAERSAVYREVARTHLQRAAQHRLLPGGHGRSGALRDVAAAVRVSPATLLTPRGLGIAMVALLAPRPVIAWASAIMARHVERAGRS